MTIYKMCSKCNEEKRPEEFSKKKTTRDGLQCQCKHCCNMNHASWREEHKEYKEIARARTAAHREECSEEINERARKRRKTWTLEQRAHSRKIKQIWEVANAATVAESRALSKAKRKDRVPPWLTKAHRREMLATYTLRDKLQALYGIKLHVDHRVPLQGKYVSGLHVPWNLQIITARENLRKSNKFEI